MNGDQREPAIVEERSTRRVHKPMTDPFRFDFIRPVDLTTLVLEGPRLRLQAVDVRFAEVMFEEFSREVTRYMYPRPAERIEETLTFIETSLQGMRAGRDMALTILRRDTEEFLGGCGMHLKRSASVPELGIWLKKSAHGHRYGLEAIRLVVEWAIEHVAFDFFVYPVDRANTPSRNIPEFLGGTVVEEGESRSMSGKALDLLVYKITREQCIRSRSLG